MPSADLNARLTLIDNLTAGLRRSGSGVRSFVRSASRQLFNLRNVFIGLGVLGVGRFITSVTKSVDEVGKLSERLGVSTEFLSRFRFAAGQAGINVRTVDMALQRVNRRFGELAEFGRGEAKPAIEALSEILGEDLSARIQRGENFEDLLLDISRAMQKVDDQTRRLSLGFKLFDSEGVALIQLLQQGPEAVEALLRRTPNVVTGQEARDAAAFNDALDELSQTFSALTKEIVITFVPALTGAIRDIAEAIQQLRNLAEDPGQLGLPLQGGATRQRQIQDIIEGTVGSGISPGEFVGPIAPPGLIQGRLNQPSFPSARARRGLPPREPIGLLAGLPGTGPGEGIFRLGDLNDDLAKSNDLIQGLARGAKDVGVAFNTFNLARESVQELSFVLAGGIASNLSAIADRTKTVREAFTDMATSIVNDLQRMITQALIARAVGALVGGLAGGFSGGGGLAGSQVQGVGGPQQSGVGFVTHGGLGPAPAAHGLFIRPGEMRHVIAHGGRHGEVVLPLGQRFRPGSFDSGGGLTIININATDAQSFERLFMGAAGRRRHDLSTIVQSTSRASSRLSRSA